MSIKKAKNRSGKTKWLVDFYTSGRGSKRIKKYFDKRIEAEEWFANYKTISANSFQKKTFEETTFKDEALFWLENRKFDFSPSHIRGVNLVLNEVLPVIGNLPPLELTADVLAALQIKLKEKRFRNKGSKKWKTPTNSTVNRKIEVIIAILNFSVKRKRIPFNPATGLEKLPFDTEEMLFWEKEEAESFLAFASGKYPFGSSKRWCYVVYLTILNTALRAGEVWGLQPQDIFNNGETLFIRRQFNKVSKTFTNLKCKKGKNRKSRHVPCNPDLLEELQSLINNNGEGSQGTIFHGDTGNPIYHSSFRKRFDRDVKEWGGRKIRLHDLRHTATTLMIRNGEDYDVVQKICGHESIETTMNYVHLLGDSIKRVGRSHSIGPKVEEENIPQLRLVSS